MDDDDIFDADLAKLDAASKAAANGLPQGGGSGRGVQQPKPQGLGPRAGPSVILVSPRQKGNGALENIKSVGWEYSDIPADFVLGATTCALFLSLKYHRLHPEYIYTRIKALGGRYNLRIVLVLVDIDNHEEPLKELSKTSLINNVTIILCWSAVEAGRYLELYKNFELAAPTSIKGIQATTYSEQLVNFVTVPRGINKTDAVSLVSTFGSIRTALNAQPESIALISGWGEKKVQRWCATVREPFRARKAKRRGMLREETSFPSALSREVTESNVTPNLSRNQSRMEDPQVAVRLGLTEPLPLSIKPINTTDGNTADADRRDQSRLTEAAMWEPGAEEEEAMAQMAMMESDQASRAPQTGQKRRAEDDALAGGVAAALSKLRKS